MKKLILIIFVITLLWVGYSISNKEEQGQDNPNVAEDSLEDSPSFVEYENEEFNFSISYPSGWDLYEAPNHQLGPIFNFYKPADLDSNPPFSHHSGITHVSIYPEGYPSEGIFGMTVGSDLDLGFSYNNARDYILQNGEVFATFINMGEWAKGWTESGFIFGGNNIKNHETICSRGGELIEDQACEPLMGDEIIHEGMVDLEDRKLVEQILESFERLN